MQLRLAAEQYLTERVVSKEYANQLRHRIKSLHDYDPTMRLSTLSSDVVNRWIGKLLDSDLARKTVHDYRAAVMALWAWAYENRLTESRPERVRRVRVPQRIPEAWTLEEMRALLAVAGRMKRNVLKTNIPRNAWWTAFIHLGYATGLRLSNLLDIEWNQVRNGFVSVVQHKTGRVVSHRLTDGACEALENLPRESKYVLPWPGAKTGIFKQLRRLVDKAGIRNGTSRYLRRSGASHVELHHPGQARKFLGHATEGMVRYYLDPSITCQKPVRPPEL